MDITGYSSTIFVNQPIAGGDKIERTASQTIPDCTLEVGSRESFDREVVEKLDLWMSTQFQSYVWRSSFEEPSVNFVVARVNGELVGRCAVVTREALLDQQPTTIQAIAGLIVKEEYRNKGLGSEIMEACMKVVRSSPVSFCILMCNRELGPFYSKLGFEEIGGQNAWFFDDRKKEQVEYKPGKGITMVYSQSKEPWKAGNLDLNGLPF